MAMTFDATAAGLPVVGPYAGETVENARLRRGALRNVPLGPGPERCVGIANRNFDCFFISIMQAIINHPRVAQFARYHHIGPRLKADGKDNLGRHETLYGCGLCQVYDLLVKYWTKENTIPVRMQEVHERLVVILERLVTYVRETSHDQQAFDKDSQHDAQEAFLHLVSWLACSGISKDGVDSADAVKALFTIEAREVFKCLNCNRETAKDDIVTWTNLQLRPDPTQKKITKWQMEQLINAALVSQLEKRCDHCSTGDKASANFEHDQSFKIAHFPELLCFHLVLFTMDNYGRTVKLDHRIAIPAEVTMNDYSDVQTNAKTITYELYAVVQHHGRGSSVDQGHYVAHIKAEDGTWTQCDDEQLLKSNLKDATTFQRSKLPYLLFYARKYPAEGRADVKQEDVEYEVPPGKKEQDKKPTAEDIVESIETPETPKTPDPPRHSPITPEPEPAPKGKPGKPDKKPSDPTYKPPPPEEESSDDDSEPIPTPTSVTPERKTLSPSPVPPTAAEVKRAYEKLKVADLKKELKSRDLSFGSKLRKSQLVNLLVKHDKTKGTLGAKKDKKVTKSKAKPKTKAKQVTLLVSSYANMKVADLKAELTRRQIAFVSKLRKAELLALLLADDQAKQVAAAGGGGVVVVDVAVPGVAVPGGKKRGREEDVVVVEEDPRTLRRSKRARR